MEEIRQSSEAALRDENKELKARIDALNKLIEAFQ
jgi:hypothetical protein